MRSEHQQIAMRLKPDIPLAEFQKIHRWNRAVVVTEKIDGHNARIHVNDEGTRCFAASRTRWISVEDDLDGFARWVADHHDELLRLGPGDHFGEWWGRGIRRNYGLKERRFSLFNATRWTDERPACCHVVPILATGLLTKLHVPGVLDVLRLSGSIAAPGFMRPEGVVVFHQPSGHLYKMTLDGNDEHKGTT